MHRALRHGVTGKLLRELWKHRAAAGLLLERGEAGGSSLLLSPAVPPLDLRRGTDSSRFEATGSATNRPLPQRPEDLCDVVHISSGVVDVERHANFSGSDRSRNVGVREPPREFFERNADGNTQE